MSNRRRIAGLTLVETVVAMSIISIAALTTSQMLAYGLAEGSSGLLTARTLLLAESYLEEITGKRFAETSPQGGVPACSVFTIPCGSIGPEAGENRATFDDVDDYHGLVDAPPRDATSAVRVGYESFRVSVEVRPASASEASSLGVASAEDLKLIAITVAHPGGRGTTQERRFVALRANF